MQQMPLPTPAQAQVTTPFPGLRRARLLPPDTPAASGQNPLATPLSPAASDRKAAFLHQLRAGQQWNGTQANLIASITAQYLKRPIQITGLEGDETFLSRSSCEGDAPAEPIKLCHDIDNYEAMIDGCAIPGTHTDGFHEGDTFFEGILRVAGHTHDPRRAEPTTINPADVLRLRRMIADYAEDDWGACIRHYKTRNAAMRGEGSVSTPGRSEGKRAEG